MKEVEDNSIKGLKKNIERERKIILEITSLSKVLNRAGTSSEKQMISSQIKLLKKSLKKESNQVLKKTKSIFLSKSFYPEFKKNQTEEKKSFIKSFYRSTSSSGLIKPSKIEKITIKRLKKKNKEKKEEIKMRKPSNYVKIATKLFAKPASKLSKTEFFKSLEKELIKANLQFIPEGYISTIILTTINSIFASIFIFLFFLFFNFGPIWPIITPVTEDIMSRLAKTFWILILIPLVTFISIYFYPNSERKSISDKINQELPFATIHMAAISNSIIEPSKIFKILIKTKEYPYIEKEFVKLVNEINIYGHDLVTALRISASKSPSSKLADLYNGFATTINSGGDLPDFFDKRAQTLLFEYRIEREKRTKSAETFMDIYISVVIAAPMILMLVLVMMRVSGFGISLSTSMISLTMVLGVSILNIFFLVFLYIKES